MQKKKLTKLKREKDNLNSKTLQTKPLDDFLIFSIPSFTATGCDLRVSPVSIRAHLCGQKIFPPNKKIKINIKTLNIVAKYVQKEFQNKKKKD
ncbi:hypothetical protein BpHYR1_001574 [Brachionus plicatilis]|uniref:Uncharacterized protein n=1 Tax=Brachionus plicatilis TaxID=10195 RepID=A0A3M7PWH9_BRAPC|nr:hypothetical protein BpHYR1_001574 [Brachionus plicatilis]